MYAVWYFLLVKFIFNYVLNERRKCKPGLSGCKMGSPGRDTLQLPLNHLMPFTDLIGLE